MLSFMALVIGASKREIVKQKVSFRICTMMRMSLLPINHVARYFIY